MVRAYSLASKRQALQEFNDNHSLGSKVIPSGCVDGSRPFQSWSVGKLHCSLNIADEGFYQGKGLTLPLNDGNNDEFYACRRQPLVYSLGPGLPKRMLFVFPT